MILEISFKLSKKKASETGFNQVLKLACENYSFHTTTPVYKRCSVLVVRNNDGYVGGVSIINGESGIGNVHFCFAQMPLGKA